MAGLWPCCLSKHSVVEWWLGNRNVALGDNALGLPSRILRIDHWLYNQLAYSRAELR